jgi:hypothetical protein
VQDINPHNKYAGEIAVQSGERVNKNFEQSLIATEIPNAKWGCLHDLEHGQDSLTFWHRNFTFKFEHTLYVKCA